ncbi:MAG: polysaccharide biosynthesis C-terminal domain-containing protein, partial [Clostridia bacterium]|nr:polysaccharide biosynthesis C-terminal domain-containing protein [Clostridia bacterium]
SYIGSVRSIWILAEKKQKYLWIINLSGALLNVILNLIMIPIWNIYGAAIASLVTQLFTNFVIGLIIKPIRRNNLLMLKGLNIRLILDYLKSNKSG